MPHDHMGSQVSIIAFKWFSQPYGEILALSNVHWGIEMGGNSSRPKYI